MVLLSKGKFNFLCICLSHMIVCFVLKGCAFLYVEGSLNSGIRPLIVSHGSNSGFHAEFSWIGES